MSYYNKCYFGQNLEYYNCRYLYRFSIKCTQFYSLLNRNLNDREPFLRVFLIPDAIDMAGTSQEKSKYNYIIKLILLIIYNNIYRYQYEIHYAYLLIFGEKLLEIQ